MLLVSLNLAKTAIINVNVENDVLSWYAKSFGCKIGVLSFSYLGFPGGFRKKSVPENFTRRI